VQDFADVVEPARRKAVEMEAMRAGLIEAPPVVVAAAPPESLAVGRAVDDSAEPN
jgi:hypothetical protein